MNYIGRKPLKEKFKDTLKNPVTLAMLAILTLSVEIARQNDYSPVDAIKGTILEQIYPLSDSYKVNSPYHYKDGKLSVALEEDYQDTIPGDFIHTASLGVLNKESLYLETFESHPEHGSFFIPRIKPQTHRLELNNENNYINLTHLYYFCKISISQPQSIPLKFGSTTINIQSDNTKIHKPFILCIPNTKSMHTQLVTKQASILLKHATCAGKAESELLK